MDSSQSPQSPCEGDNFDWAATVAASQKNPRLLRVTAEAAVEELPQLMESIQHALARQDPSALRMAAHTLKGGAKYFGVNPLAERAERLEMMGRQADLRDAPALAAMMAGDLTQLLAALRQWLTQHATD